MNKIIEGKRTQAAYEAKNVFNAEEGTIVKCTYCFGTTHHDVGKILMIYTDLDDNKHLLDLVSGTSWGDSLEGYKFETVFHSITIN